MSKRLNKVAKDLIGSGSSLQIVGADDLNARPVVVVFYYNTPDVPDEMAESRWKANGLYERMCKLVSYTVVWNDILDSFNCTHETLQNSKLDLNSVVSLLESLKKCVVSKRD